MMKTLLVLLQLHGIIQQTYVPLIEGLTEDGFLIYHQQGACWHPGEFL